MSHFFALAGRLGQIVVLAGVIVAVCFTGSQAQVTTGTISGTVQDSSGAVVPGAQLTISHTDTGNSRSVTADAQGRYLAPNLTLGGYTVQATSQGFQSEVRQGIRLTVGQNAVINFSLAPGAVTESVTIIAEAPIVDTTSSAVGNLVNREQINELPLNGRDFVQLVTLQPGVVMYREQNRELNRGNGTRLSIAGARSNQVSYRLNGLDISDGAGTTPGSATGNNLGVDAIQEFQVLTNNFSAEYGKSAGGVINVVHKSGSNNLHGSLFEYLRNDNFDATRWEVIRFAEGEPEKPEFKRNQFGGTAGGPVIRDKTFFFGAFEGLRDRSNTTTVERVPSLNARNGIIGNTTIAVSPAVRPYLNTMPLPNITPDPSAPDDGTAFRSQNFSTNANENYVVGKMDHTFSESDSLGGSYTFDQGTTLGPAPRGGMPMLNDNSRTRSQYVTLREVHTFSPTVLNTFNLGFNRSFGTGTHDPLEQYPANLAFLPGATWQTLEITGLANTEYNFIADRPDRTLILNTWQISDNVTVVKGAHSLQFGFEAYRFAFRYITEGRTGGGGRFQFTSLQNFLRNVTRRWEVQDPSALGLQPSITQKMFGWFAQDDVRVSPTLTLNLGLRYEAVTKPQDEIPIQSNLFSLTDPRLTTGKTFWSTNPSLKSFAPRVGFAWDAFGNQKTAVRGGMGLFFDPLGSYYYLPVIQGNPPFRLGRRINSASFPGTIDQVQSGGNIPFELTIADASLDQPYRIQYNLGVQHEVMPNTMVGATFVGGQGVHTTQMYLNANTRRPTFLSDGRVFFDAVANAGDPAGRVNPNFGTVQYRQTGGHASYNSLQLAVNRRMTGMQFQMSYTFSKSIDNGDTFSFSSEGGNTVAQQNIYQPGLERGLSSFDARHVFSSNATIELPKLEGAPAAARHTLGGWQVGGILSLSSGHPFTPYVDFDNANIITRSGGDHLRPDVRPGVNLKEATDSSNPDQFFDPAALFVLPESGFLGNLSRGSLTGPGNAVVDFNLRKTIAMGESKFLRFRAEFFNLFNRRNFRAPEDDQRAVFVGRNANGSGEIPRGAGQITSTTGSARQIQFSLRYEF